jgi:hypothetical protein
MFRGIGRLLTKLPVSHELVVRVRRIKLALSRVEFDAAKHNALVAGGAAVTIVRILCPVVPSLDRSTTASLYVRARLNFRLHIRSCLPFRKANCTKIDRMRAVMSVKRGKRRGSVMR